ncbi:hypothetical protein ACIQLJ_04090 [Microbacterium sp. NPDC091313]
MYDLLMAAAATPSPSPSAPPDDLVTPGPAGFAVIALLAVAVFALVFDMLRRIRRGRYRAEVREDLDAAEKQGEAASRASETDDQDIDPGQDARPRT